MNNPHIIIMANVTLESVTKGDESINRWKEYCIEPNGTLTKIKHKGDPWTLKL